jgi:hypothetical protein
LDNSTNILNKLLKHLDADMENAGKIFDGCAKLLGTMTACEQDVESILLSWIDTVPLDYYIAHCNHFSNFLSFIWTVCHFLDPRQGNKVWSKLLVFYNGQENLENIREILTWSTKFEFALDAMPELEWVCETDFSMDVSDPEIVANILLLFGKSS